MFRARTRALRSLGDAGGIGLEMAVFLIIGIKGGQWLDEYFDTEPWLLRIGLAFGIFAGFRNLLLFAGIGVTEKKVRDASPEEVDEEAENARETDQH